MSCTQQSRPPPPFLASRAPMGRFRLVSVMPTLMLCTRNPATVQTSGYARRERRHLAQRVRAAAPCQQSSPLTGLLCAAPARWPSAASLPRRPSALRASGGRGGGSGPSRPGGPDRVASPLQGREGAARGPGVLVALRGLAGRGARRRSWRRPVVQVPHPSGSREASGGQWHTMARALLPERTRGTTRSMRLAVMLQLGSTAAPRCAEAARECARLHRLARSARGAGLCPAPSLGGLVPRRPAPRPSRTKRAGGAPPASSGPGAAQAFDQLVTEAGCKTLQGQVSTWSRLPSGQTQAWQQRA